MSIVNEALKKASKEEKLAPQTEIRRFTFSARSLDQNRIIRILIPFVFLIIIISFFGMNLISDLLSKKAIKTDTPIIKKIPKQLEGDLAKKEDTSKIWEEASRLNQEGLKLYRAKKFNEAKEAFSRAINIRPDYAIAHNNLGLIYMEEGRGKEAEIRYRTAIKLDPNYPEALNNLGLLYAKEGNYEEAIGLYKDTLKIKPDYPDAHLNLAMMLERYGHFAEAKGHYNSFIEYAPKERQAAILKVKNHLEDLL